MRLNWRTVLLRVGTSIGVALLTIAYAGAVVPQDGVVDWREALLTVTGLIVSSGLLLSIPAHWGREGIRHLINQLHAARSVRKRPATKHLVPTEEEKEPTAATPDNKKGQEDHHE